MTVHIIHADVLAGLRELPDESVHAIITSPPYYGLRSYGIPPSVWGGDPACDHEFGEEGRRRRGGPPGPSAINAGRDRSAQAETAVVNTGAFCEKCHAWRGHFGLEPTYPLYVKHMVLIMREARRVLRSDGVMWLNLGDSYATGAGGVGARPGGGAQGDKWAGAFATRDGTHAGKHTAMAAVGPMTQPNRMPQPGLKPKDLMMIPERVAIALQDDGWYLRSRSPWIKRNAMPESANDRPANATEYVFLLTKSEHYFYDRWAVQVPSSDNSHARAARARNTEYQAPGQPAQRGSAGKLRPNVNKKPVAGWATGAGDHSVLAHNTPQDGPTKLLRPPGVNPKAAAAEVGTKANASFSAAVVDIVPARNRRNTDWFFESWQGMLQDDEGLPLAFVVNPAGFKEAHFATFPTKLVEPMVLAGTSEKGCCALCGAPWRRLVVKGAELDDWKRACGADSNGEYNGEATKDYEGTGAQDPSAVKARILAGMREKITAGWAPTCECAPTEPVPCVVLDIFGGSGTTALVAKRHQRDAISIEIGEQYVGMQADRLTADSPLFNDVTVQVVS